MGWFFLESVLILFSKKIKTDSYSLLAKPKQSGQKHAIFKHNSLSQLILKIEISEKKIFIVLYFSNTFFPFTT